MGPLTRMWLNRECELTIGKRLEDCTDEEVERAVDAWEAEFLPGGYDPAADVAPNRWHPTADPFPLPDEPELDSTRPALLLIQGCAGDEP